MFFYLFFAESVVAEVYRLIAHVVQHQNCGDAPIHLLLQNVNLQAVIAEKANRTATRFATEPSGQTQTKMTSGKGKDIRAELSSMSLTAELKMLINRVLLLCCTRSSLTEHFLKVVWGWSTAARENDYPRTATTGLRMAREDISISIR